MDKFLKKKTKEKKEMSRKKYLKKKFYFELFFQPTFDNYSSKMFKK
jgi:hypothetical protein